MRKRILHLCADIGSDSKIYADHPDEYEVIKIGKDIGVENYHAPYEVYGIIANPPCTEFSIVHGFDVERDYEKGLKLVRECQRIVAECRPKFWAIENPASGRLKLFLGTPTLIYEPWQYGSPWTKKTALWGNFNVPPKLYSHWDDVPKNNQLYIRPGRKKPSIAFMHKSAINLIPEFQCFKVEDDMSFKSLCSQGFAKAFFEVNR